MELKYIIFFIATLVTVPVGALLAANHQKTRDFVFAALVIGTTQPGSIFGLPSDINFLSREWYRGSTRGIEISYLDLLAMILLVGSLLARRREGNKMFWPPSLGLLIAYFGWCTLSVALLSDPKIFGLFELTKILRGIILFVAVVAYIRGPREIIVFLWALVAAIGYEAAICLRDRYIYGIHRIRGTLEHANSLSMYALQCVPIFIVSFFSREISPRLRNACIVAFVAASGCIMLSISRTGFAALVLLTACTVTLSTGFRFTTRNVSLAALVILLGTLMTLKSWDSVVERLVTFDFQREYFTQEGDRGSYFRQAAPIMRDRPVFGTGLNNWSYWVSNKYAAEAGYLAEPYESTDFPPERRGQMSPAHNLYVLTAAELGWPGLLILLILFARWIAITGSAIFIVQKDLMARLRIGAFLSLCGILLQSWTEWEFRQTSMFFLGHIIMGVAAVLYYHGRANIRR